MVETVLTFFQLFVLSVVLYKMSREIFEMNDCELLVAVFGERDPSRG